MPPNQILSKNDKNNRKIHELNSNNHRVEEELRVLTDTADGDGTTKRKSARRSFFRRKKHHRSSSRDSKDLSSFSSTQLSWFTDSLGEDGTLAGYQRVERLECMWFCLWYLLLWTISDIIWCSTIFRCHVSSGTDTWSIERLRRW